MTPQTQKRLIWCSVAIALVITLLAVLLVTAPLIVRSPTFKDLVVGFVYDRFGGRLDYSDLHLKFSPYPSVHLREPSLLLPDALDARAGRLTVAIRVLPLLTGRLRLLELSLDSPRATFFLADSAPTASGGNGNAAQASSADPIRNFIKGLKQVAGRAAIKIQQGRLDLLNGDQEMDTWREVALTYTPGAALMTLEAVATSTVLGDLKADLLIDPLSLDMDGRIEIGDIALPRLMATFSPNFPITVSKGRLRLEIHLNTQQPGALGVRLSAAIPTLDLERNHQTIRLEGLQLEAGFERLSDGIRIELASLKTAKPSLAISGTVRHSRGAEWNLELTTDPFDIAPVRTLARTWAADLAAVDILFDILRSGSIQSITTRSSASSPRGLLALKRIKMAAQVDGAAIRIPGTDLDLKAVAGRVDLDQGVLAAQIDSGGPIGTHLADGRFKMDLANPSLPLEAKVDLQTDLVKLPEILSKVLSQEAQRTMTSEIEALSGTAGGRFEIKGPAADLDWAVQVDDLEARLKSPRLPMGVEIEAAAGRYADATLTVDTLSGRVGRSTIEGVSGSLSFGKRPMVLNGSGRLKLALGELFEWAKTWDTTREMLRPIQSVDGRLIVSAFHFSGPLYDPQAADYRLKGRLQALRAVSEHLPGALTLSGGAFQAASDHIDVTNLKATVSDTSLTATGTLTHPFSADRSLQLSMDGIIGPNIAGWALSKWGGGDHVRFKHPIALSRFSVVSDLTGRHAVSTTLQPVDGPSLTAELRLAPEKISIPVLTLTDDRSDARFSFERHSGELSAHFSGHLDFGSLKPFLKGLAPQSGWATGDWRATLAGGDWHDTRMTGQLKGGAFALPPLDRGAAVPRLERFSVTATGSQLVIHAAALKWNGMGLDLDGWLGGGDTGLNFDLHARSPFIDVDKILARIGEKAHPPLLADTQASSGRATWRGALSKYLTGDLRLDVDHLTYTGRHIRPLAARIRFEGERVLVEIPQATLCDSTLAGSLDIVPNQIQLQLQPTSAARNAGQALGCLFQKPIEADGRLYLVGGLSATGSAKGSVTDLVRQLNGPVNMTATEGRIYKAHLLTRILALVNVTEIFAGQYPGFTEEGMAYKLFEFDGQFKNGIFTIETCSLDGPTLRMTCAGNIDLPDKTLDITVLAAPLKTVDRIVKHLPVIGYILGGSLISIPIKVKGPLSDPTVVPLSPSAVGEGLLEMMKRTFQLPVKLFTPQSAAP